MVEAWRVEGSQDDRETENEGDIVMAPAIA
jgi:hypothetical protein